MIIIGKFLFRLLRVKLIYLSSVYSTIQHLDSHDRMSLCCPVSVKRHHEGPALVIVIFCRLVLAFGANRFRGEKYHSFSVVMLYSHVFPADLTVTYTV